MNKSMEKLDVMDKKQYKTWAKSTEKDGYTKRVKVSEIENGFLVCLEEYGEKDGKYVDTNKKYYSKTNPLCDMEPEEYNPSQEVKQAIKSFLDY